MIDWQKHHDRQLTIFTCDGRLTLTEFKEALREYYRSQPTRNLFWDLARADVSGASPEEAEELARFVKELAHSRDGGRNAIVAPDSSTFGLAKIYQLFAENVQQTSQTRIFKTRQEAEAWLDN